MRAELDRRVTEAGMGTHPGEGRMLVHAARVGAVRQNVLAERMGIEAMTLSGFLDRLEEKGLVTRSADPADRRARMVEISPRRRRVLIEIRAIAGGILAEAWRSHRAEDGQLVTQV